jgi:hypothetical protein
MHVRSIGARLQDNVTSGSRTHKLVSLKTTGNIVTTIHLEVITKISELITQTDE